MTPEIPRQSPKTKQNGSRKITPQGGFLSSIAVIKLQNMGLLSIIARIELQNMGFLSIIALKHEHCQAWADLVSSEQILSGSTAKLGRLYYECLALPWKAGCLRSTNTPEAAKYTK